MRALSLAAMLAVLTAGLVFAPAQATHQAPDGVTALTTTNNGIANEVFRPDANGNINVRVIIFEKDGAGVWKQVAKNAALRVFTWGDNVVQVQPAVQTSPAIGVGASATVSFTGDWTDKVNIPFTSAANGVVSLSFPASAVANAQGTGPNNGVDIFVTFASPAGHTSHHSIAKNQLINAQRFDEADQLDYHGAIYGVVLA